MNQGKSGVIDTLDLEEESDILTQASPFTDEKVRQRERAQGHQLVSSGSCAKGIQIWISGTLVKFSSLLMWCLKHTHLFLGIEFSATGSED